MHLCRGNFKSTFAASGDYEPVAEALLAEMDIDAYFLEYDDARSGDFKPLRFLQPGKTAVLGLITSKVGELEDKDALKRRIDDAAKYAPLEQLALSPQCGFASSAEGNDISWDNQRRKLELVVDVARGGVGRIAHGSTTRESCMRSMRNGIILAAAAAIAACATAVVPVSTSTPAAMSAPANAAGQPGRRQQRGTSCQLPASRCRGHVRRDAARATRG